MSELLGLFLGLFLMGAVASLSVCTVSCLGTLAPMILADGRGFRTGIMESFIFMSGKIILYATLAAVVAWSGSRLPPQLLFYTAPVSGGFLILLGLYLHFRTDPKGQCHRNKIQKAHFSFRTGKQSLRSTLLFLTGLFTSLLPCPALLALLTLASRANSVAVGFLYGLTYGVGLLLSPILFAGGGLSMIAKKIHMESAGVIPVVRAVAAAVIIISGIRMVSLSL